MYRHFNYTVCAKKKNIHPTFLSTKCHRKKSEIAIQLGFVFQFILKKKKSLEGFQHAEAVINFDIFMRNTPFLQEILLF